MRKATVCARGACVSEPARARRCPLCECHAIRDWEPQRGPAMLHSPESMPSGGGLKKSDDVVLFTDLDVAECQRRLNARVDQKRQPFLGYYAGNQRIVGKIAGNRLSLGVRGYADTSFAPSFSGRLCVQAHGTRVEGYFKRGIPLLSDKWMFAGMALLAVALFFACLGELLAGTVTFGSVVVLIGFPLCVAYLARCIRHANDRTRVEILDFLQEALVAQIEPRP